MNDDLQVIQRVLAGDVDSFRILVKRHEGPLCCMIKNLIHNTVDSEDIAQETFLAAFANLSYYDSRQAAFSTWLFTIARNKCFNAQKKKKKTMEANLPPRSEHRNPEHEMAETELFGHLDAALADLPFEQKVAFVLSEIQERSYQEIAQIEGIKLGTVKSRVSRAKEQIRSILQKQWSIRHAK